MSVRSFLKMDYIYDVSYNAVCTIFEFLEDDSIEDYTPIKTIKFTPKDGDVHVYEVRQWLDVLSKLSKEHPNNFVVDIDMECLRITTQRPDKDYDEMSAYYSFECFLEDIKDSPRDYELFCEIYKKYKYYLVDKEEDKEETGMNKIFPELKCGKVNSEAIKMSHLGIAVKNKEGIFVAYDKTAKAIVNVDIASIDGKSFLFQLPVQTSEIKVGDCIVHNDAYFCITNVSPLKGINYYDGTEDVIQLTTSMFGFNFITKVVSMLDLTAGGGNNNMMLPLLMFGEKDNGSSNDMMKAMLMMSMMQQPTGQTQNGQMNMNNMFNNPMMLMALAGDNNDMSTLMIMSMMQQQMPVNNNGGNTNA